MMFPLNHLPIGEKPLDSGLWYWHYIMNIDTNQPMQRTASRLSNFKVFE